MTGDRGEKLTLCPVREAARKTPDRPALMTSDRIITYEEYDRQTTAAAAFLRERDLTALAVITANTVSLPPLLAGAFRAGTTVHLLNPRQPAVISKEHIENFKCPAVVNLAEPAEFDNMNVIAADEILHNDKTAPEPEPQIDLNRPATVMMTSGSSDLPKAVLHTYGNHYYNALGSNRNLPFGPGERWLWSLPACHVGGLSILFRAVLGGGAVAVDNRRQSLSEQIIENKITHLSLVPTQLWRLLQEKENLPGVIKTLKAVLIGGGPTADKLLEEALRENLPLNKTYGLTETASQVCTTARGDMPRKVDSSGRPLACRELKISETGEIKVKGTCLFKGYLEKDRLVKPFDNDGWFATGDCGFIDDEGFLYVTGRRDNLFVSGGENIQPEEIERCLCRADNIAAALVVPVHSEEYGLRPAAFVKTGDGTAPDMKKLELFLRNSLPGFKIPDYFFPWPEKAGVEDLKPKREEFAKLARSLIGRDRLSR